MDALPDLSSLDTTRLARSLRPSADEVGLGWDKAVSIARRDAETVAEAILGCARKRIKTTLEQVLENPPSDWFWDRISVCIAVKLILCASALTPYNAPEVDNIVNIVIFKLFRSVKVADSKAGTSSDWQKIFKPLNAYNEGTDTTTLMANKWKIELATWPLVQLVDACLLIVVIKLKEDKGLIRSPCIDYATQLVNKYRPFLFQSDWIEKLVHKYGVSSLSNFPADSGQLKKVYDVAKAMEKEFDSMYEVTPTELGTGKFGSVNLARRKGSTGESDLAIKQVLLKYERLSALQTREIFMWGLVKSDEKYVSRLENIGVELHHDGYLLDLLFVSKLAIPFDKLLGKIHKAGKKDNGTATERYLVFAKRSLRHLVSGVKALHDMDILHLDLKPANMVLNPRTFNVQIIDFGGAFQYSEDVFTKTTPEEWRYKRGGIQYVTSPAYTAPELLCGMLQGTRLGSFAVSKACDVWSIGVVATKLFHPELHYPNQPYPHPYGIFGNTPRGIFYLTSNFPNRSSSMYTTFPKGFGELFDIEEPFTSENGRNITSYLKQRYIDYFSREDQETFDHLMQFWKIGCFPIEPAERKDASELLDMPLLRIGDGPIQRDENMETAIKRTK